MTTNMNTKPTPAELSSSLDCPPPPAAPAIQRVTARSAEVGGGIPVNRLMPSRQRRMIGAWCFLDHAGPAVFQTGAGLRVGPHPHTGLQTFTWMIEGEVLHRDSLGHVQVVRPGQVNLMTAGRGIAHTEESLPDQDKLHAAQLWIALPAKDSDCEPAFDHHPELPTWEENGCRFTLLTGHYAGHTAPAKQYSPLLGIDLSSAPGAAVKLALDPGFEYGILILDGNAHINGECFAINELAYLGQGLSQAELQLQAGSRAILLGGAPFGEEILLWWNFVGHSKQQIAAAQADWERGDARFGVVNGWDGAPLVAPPLPWKVADPA